MKPRRVIVTLELECGTSLELLKKGWWWQKTLREARGPWVEVVQAQANSVSQSYPLTPGRTGKKARHA